MLPDKISQAAKCLQDPVSKNYIHVQLFSIRSTSYKLSCFEPTTLYSFRLILVIVFGLFLIKLFPFVMSEFLTVKDLINF